MSIRGFKSNSNTYPLVRAKHVFRGKGGGGHNRASLYDSFDELSPFHGNGSPLLGMVESAVFMPFFYTA